MSPKWNSIHGSCNAQLTQIPIPLHALLPLSTSYLSNAHSSWYLFLPMASPAHSLHHSSAFFFLLFDTRPYKFHVLPSLVCHARSKRISLWYVFILSLPVLPLRSHSPFPLLSSDEAFTTSHNHRPRRCSPLPGPLSEIGQNEYAISGAR